MLDTEPHGCPIPRSEQAALLTPWYIAQIPLRTVGRRRTMKQHDVRGRITTNSGRPWADAPLDIDRVVCLGRIGRWPNVR